MSLTQQLRTRFHRVPLLGFKKTAPADYIHAQYQADWKTITKVWPDGTWTMKWGGGSTTGAVMDDVTRGFLVDLWAYEDLRSTGKFFGMKLDAAKFTANPIPDDWYPSEKQYRKYALKQRCADAVANHVVERLRNLGHLKA